MLSQNIDIKALRTGDEMEFHRFFNLFYPRLMSLACRFVPEYVAEDIVQDVFIKYWEQKEMLTPDSLHSYLYKCTQNDCLNYIKHQHIEDDYASMVREAEERILMIAEHSDVNVLWNEMLERDVRKMLREAIEKLPPKCREAFVLSFYHELTYKEIAVRMGISSRTVEEHVQKAYKVLRDLLKHLLFFILMSI